MGPELPDAPGYLALVEAAGLCVRACVLDVTRAESFEPPEGLRVLVNNAGVEGDWLPVEHTPASQWRDVFETNFFGLVEVTRRALPALRRAGGGVVCNVTSCSLFVPMPLLAAYRASKAAVSALGETLRVELAPHGVRVLEVVPGAIATDMLAGTAAPPAAGGCAGYEELARRVHSSRSASAGQPTRPEQAAVAIAEAILSDDAPLRVSCDGMGAGLLAAWRASDDESMQSGLLGLFGSPGSHPSTDS